MNEYSKYLSLKSSIENLLGTEAWYALKESDSISIWRKFLGKALRALKVSIHETVQICDDDWLSEVDVLIEHGLEGLKRHNSIDELISCMAATLLNISFLQTGLLPRRKATLNCVSLRKENWRHDSFRQVVYLQTPKQRESLFLSKQQKSLGIEKQMETGRIYQLSGSKLPYSQWCQTDESLNK